MKIIFVFLIMFAFGIVAYNYKQKFKMKIKILDEVISYINFYKTNIAFYKESLYTINSKYNITHKNKNANSNIFTIKNNLYLLNKDKIIKYIKHEEYDLINQFLTNIGTQISQIELESCDGMIKYLSKIKEETCFELKNKGELWFKIILMIGAAISIIIW